MNENAWIMDVTGAWINTAHVVALNPIFKEVYKGQGAQAVVEIITVDGSTRIAEPNYAWATTPEIKQWATYLDQQHEMFNGDRHKLTQPRRIGEVYGR